MTQTLSYIRNLKRKIHRSFVDTNKGKVCPNNIYSLGWNISSKILRKKMNQNVGTNAVPRRRSASDGVVFGPASKSVLFDTSKNEPNILQDVRKGFSRPGILVAETNFCGTGFLGTWFNEMFRREFSNKILHLARSRTIIYNNNLAIWFQNAEVRHLSISGYFNTTFAAQVIAILLHQHIRFNQTVGNVIRDRATRAGCRPFLTYGLDVPKVKTQLDQLSSIIDSWHLPPDWRRLAYDFVCLKFLGDSYDGSDTQNNGASFWANPYVIINDVKVGVDPKNPFKLTKDDFYSEKLYLYDIFCTSEENNDPLRARGSIATQFTRNMERVLYKLGNNRLCQRMQIVFKNCLEPWSFKNSINLSNTLWEPYYSNEFTVNSILNYPVWSVENGRCVDHYAANSADFGPSIVIASKQASFSDFLWLSIRPAIPFDEIINSNGLERFNTELPFPGLVAPKFDYKLRESGTGKDIPINIDKDIFDDTPTGAYRLHQPKVFEIVTDPDPSSDYLPWKRVTDIDQLRKYGFIKGFIGADGSEGRSKEELLNRYEQRPYYQKNIDMTYTEYCFIVTESFKRSWSIPDGFQDSFVNVISTASLIPQMN